MTTNATPGPVEVTFRFDTNELFDAVARVGDGGTALGQRIVGAMLTSGSVGFSEAVGMAFYGVTIPENTRIEAARPVQSELVEALRWYGEQARLARLIHSEGDAGRHALAGDGGKRAQEALAKATGDGL